MSLTPLHVCMDSLSSDWLRGTVHEECGMDCSSPSGDMLTCSRPLMERRLRPQHDQPLKCPRCDSTHTKFCYYNNYSLSQPRYFCKSCRRYWTKGGTLRNIPVGGGCRKNKKVSKKSNHNDSNISTNSSPSSSLHLHHYNPNATQFGHANPIYMLQGPNFMDSSSSRNYDIMGNGDDFGMVNGLNHHDGLAPIGYHSLCESPFGMGNVDGTCGSYMDTCQRMVVPCDQIQRQPNDYENDNDQLSSVDVKPNTKVLSLEWQDQGCSDNGYLNSTNWAGLMNGFGSSTTKPMV